MFRRLFTIVSALSLLLCVAAAVLWVRSHRARAAVQFRSGGALWEVASERGRLRLNNAPQCRLELQRAVEERRRLYDECLRLSQENSALRKRLQDASADERPAVQAEMARLKVLQLANGKARGNLPAKPASVTPPVDRSAPHAAATAAAGLPLLLWLVGVAHRRARRRRRQENRLCTGCGYDLRESPQRCPECGAVPA